MSCGCSSGSSYDGGIYGGVCNADIPYPSVSHESVPSLIDNLVYALYGVIEKDVTSGKVVWNIPCDPSNTPAGINGIPRNEGEGLLCYIIRALNLTTATAGYVTANGVETLTNKTLVSPTITGSGAIAGVFTGNITGSVTGNLTGDVTGNLTGNVTGNVTGNAGTATTLATGRTIALSGDVTGTATSFNGSANISIPVTINAGSVTPTDLSTGGPTWDTSGNLRVGTTSSFGKTTSAVNFGNGNSGSNFTATPVGDAQGQRAGYSYRSTFVGTADNTPRRTADITAGFSSGWGTEYLAIGVGNNGTPNDTSLETAEKVRILSNGNVGIGTSTPASDLEIKDGTRSLRIDANLSPTGNTYISSSGSTDGLLIGTTDDKTISFFTNNTLQATFTNNSLDLQFNQLVNASSIELYNGVMFLSGNYAPEGNLTAPKGSLYTNTTGGTATTVFFVKTTGSGNTGWTAK